MRLDFNVLWVDDQPNYVQAQYRRIARHMEEQGFEFKPVHCLTLDDVRQKISSEVFNDEVDLILVDWDLGNDQAGNEVRGQHVIEAVRDELRYKDVVFYSAHTTADDLRRLAFEARLEGVFCTGRNELVQEVLDVFDSLVKRILDLDHTRGIVMGATSDIDYMVAECLRHAHGKLNDAGRTELIERALKHIDDRLQGIVKKLETIRASATFEALIEDHLIFPANDRLRMLANLLELESFKPHQASRKSVTNYMASVVPGRNYLGHKVAEKDGGPRHILDNKGKPIGIEEARELRRSILGLRTDFRDLLEALQAPPA